MFYAIPLYPGRTFTVPSPGDLGEGWAFDSDLLEAIAQGRTLEAITEAELPAPLDNPTYPGLQLYRLETAQGAEYVGVVAYPQAETLEWTVWQRVAPHGRTIRKWRFATEALARQFQATKQSASFVYVVVEGDRPFDPAAPHAFL